MFKNYSGIARTLCNLNIFRILAYSELEAYVEPCYIWNPDIFRALAYSEPEVYSEPWKTSEMEHFAKIINGYSCFCNISFSRSLLFSIKAYFFLQKYLKKYTGPGGRDPEFWYTHSIYKNNTKKNKTKTSHF